jgi:hypothetical protein
MASCFACQNAFSGIRGAVNMAFVNRLLLLTYGLFAFPEIRFDARALLQTMLASYWRVLLCSDSKPLKSETCIITAVTCSDHGSIAVLKTSCTHFAGFQREDDRRGPSSSFQNLFNGAKMVRVCQKHVSAYPRMLTPSSSVYRSRF